MWIATPTLFVSIVRKPGDTHLTVRARRRGDLERFLALATTPATPIRPWAGTDYPFRASLAPAALARALTALAGTVTYPNMKGAIPPGDRGRRLAYGRAWGALLSLETPAPGHRAPGSRARGLSPRGRQGPPLGE